MPTAHPIRRTLPILIAAALALAACARPTLLQDPPENFTFQPAREGIPGVLVQSGTLRLKGMRSTKRVLVRAEGDAERLIVNGEPVGRTARVKPGSKLKVAVRAPGYGETAVGIVRVNGSTAEFRVSSIRRPPSGRLYLGEVETRSGRTARSRVVAPRDFPFGALLVVERPGVKVETRHGTFDPPVALAPGEPFRLILPVPEGTVEPIEVPVRLDGLRDTWRIRLPEARTASNAAT